jgi:hypothetical protein
MFARVPGGTCVPGVTNLNIQSQVFAVDPGLAADPVRGDRGYTRSTAEPESTTIFFGRVSEVTAEVRAKVGPRMRRPRGAPSQRCTVRGR